MTIPDFFKDENGRVVIAQWPNPPLWTAVAAFLLRYLPFPWAGALSFWGVLLALSYWSYLEIRYGDSGFRRLLGLAVALSQVLKLGRLFF